MILVQCDRWELHGLLTTRKSNLYRRNQCLYVSFKTDEVPLV